MGVTCYLVVSCDWGKTKSTPTPFNWSSVGFASSEGSLTIKAAIGTAQNWHPSLFDEYVSQVSWVPLGSTELGAIVLYTSSKKEKFTILCPSGQYLVKRSHSVRGIVKVHRRRLLTARLATNIFLGVRSTFKQNTWNIYEYSNWSSLFLLSEWAATNYFQKILIELSNNRVRWVWHGQIN